VWNDRPVWWKRLGRKRLTLTSRQYPRRHIWLFSFCLKTNYISCMCVMSIHIWKLLRIGHKFTISSEIIKLSYKEVPWTSFYAKIHLSFGTVLSLAEHFFLLL
jgi:hypothetical protein